MKRGFSIVNNKYFQDPPDSTLLLTIVQLQDQAKW